MKMKTRLIAFFAALVMVMAFCPVSGQSWEPYQFEGNEKYEFEITYFDNGEPVNSFYTIDIKNSGTKDSNGEELFDVSYTTTGKVAKSELGAQTAFGLNAYGFSISMAFLNPMYAMFFAQMELKVGEKMSFFGAGYTEITGKESVAGRDGYICKFYMKDDNGSNELVSEWIIDPDLAFPMKSIVYDNGEEQSNIILTNYSKY